MKIKRIASTLLATCLLTGIVSAQEKDEKTEKTDQSPASGWTAPPASSAAAADEKSPGLQFEYLHHDFGKADEGASVEMEFPFINTSSDIITVTNVKASCGCTAAQLQKKTFAPGEGEAIKSTFNTKDRTGTQHKTITVTTDDEDNPVYRLSFRGDVISKVYLEQKLLNFGEVMQGEEKAMTFHLINVSGQDLQISNLVSAAGGLKFEDGAPAAFTDKATGAEGVKIPVTVTIPSDYPQGPIATTLAIQTDYKDRPSHIGTIRGTVRGEVNIQPARIYFGFVKPGEAAERNFALSVLENKSFTLKSYSIEAEPAASKDEASKPVVEVTQMEAGANAPEQNFSVSLTAPEINGRVGGDIVLQGDIEGQSRTVRIPFNAYVRDISAIAPAKAQPSIRGANPDVRARVSEILKEREEAKGNQAAPARERRVAPDLEKAAEDAATN